MLQPLLLGSLNCVLRMCVNSFVHQADQKERSTFPVFVNTKMGVRADSVCSNGSGSSIDGKGRRHKPRSKNTDLTASHIAVFDSVGEEAGVIADSFFASVDLACASLECSTHRTSKKGAMRDTNDTEIKDVVAFEVTSESHCMNLDFCRILLVYLPQKSGCGTQDEIVT